jgi:beta-apo-4'-carotenal oxygenase
VVDKILSGGANINESFMSGSIQTVPFGGVGSSGMGSYRGKASFDAFSHARVICTTPSWLEKLLRIRYMPYNMEELNRLKKLTAPKPDFDREGRQIRGLAYWSSLLLRLGAKSGKGAFLRWFIVLSSWYVLTFKKEWLSRW